MKRQYLLLLICSCFCASSCLYRIAFSSLGVFDTSVEIRKIRNAQKEIVFIPMHHIGKKEFYADVKFKIDSLRKNNFVCYFEGVKVRADCGLSKKDTLIMKLRKISGLDFKAMEMTGGYIDTANSKFVGMKKGFIKKNAIVNQPRSYALQDTSIDKRADVFLEDLIAAFEESEGPIILTACDYATGSGSMYNCRKYKSASADKFIIDYRNKYVVNEVIHDEHTKIAIVYGAKHFKGILKYLRLNDPNWTIIK